jgi:hypothetical protein
LELKILVAVVSMRKFEKKAGFDTENQILNYGKLLKKFDVVRDEIKMESRVKEIVELITKNI